MRYDDPKVQEVLAGEYVLGALHGAARQRFESLMHTRPALRSLVRQWQDDLTPLAAATPPVAPPRRILSNLERALRHTHASGRRSLWEWLEFWRAFAAVGALAVVVLSVYLGNLLTTPAELVTISPNYVAVVQDEVGEPKLVVTAYPKPWRLRVEPLAALTEPEQGSLRLWAVERESGVTRALATISAGIPQRIALNEEDWGSIKTAEALIISIEQDPGASERPTGRILYAGRCINLKGPSQS